MLVVYELIYGNKWGGGHLHRALNFKNNSSFDVEFHIHFEKKTNKSHFHKNLKLVTASKKKIYDIHINDTLGLYKYQFNSLKLIYLDAISQENNSSICHEHILYPNKQSSLFRYYDYIFDRKLKNIGIIQGTSDDHKQLIKIVQTIPQNYHKVIFTTNNCRHLKKISNYVNKNINIDLIINAKFTQYIKMFEIIITAGGNTLLEVLKQKSYNTKVIVYTKEKKELLNFNILKKNKNILKVFKLNETFSWNLKFDL